MKFPFTFLNLTTKARSAPISSITAQNRHVLI